MTLSEIFFGLIIPLIFIPALSWCLADHEERTIRKKSKKRIWPYTDQERIVNESK